MRYDIGASWKYPDRELVEKSPNSKASWTSGTILRQQLYILKLDKLTLFRESKVVGRVLCPVHGASRGQFVPRLPVLYRGTEPQNHSIIGHLYSRTACAQVREAKAS